MKENDIEKIVDGTLACLRVSTRRDFIQFVKNERQLASQYRGREIFELLQNIDDALLNYNGPSDNRIASISFNGEWLEIANHGNPFSISDLERLCQGGVSGKDAKYIGCKGIGFRSVLNWSDNIEIYSGYSEDSIAVRFSKVFAYRQFEKISMLPHIKCQIEELRRIEVRPDLPILSVPESISMVEKDYDTVIRLHVKPFVRTEIVNSIKKFESQVILFLPNIQEIRFTIDNDFSNIITKECRGNDRYEIYENGKCMERYFLREKAKDLGVSFKHEGSSIAKMIVAIPDCDNYLQKKYKLYSFFPINDVDSPFKAILHATFCLSPNRNRIETDNDETLRINREVFKHLVHFYIETVCLFAEREKRLCLLMPKDFKKDGIFFNVASKSMICEADYMASCKKHPVFFTVNEEYISGNDNPILVKDAPSFFKGIEFAKVVNINPTDGRLSDFSSALAGNASIESNLTDAINKVSKDWDPKKCAETFKWWIQNGFKSLPLLLRKSDGNFLSNPKEPCFLAYKEDSERSDIPAWANISILSPEYERALTDVFREEIECIKQERKKEGSGASDKRALPAAIRKLTGDPLVANIQEQSSHEVLIEPVNNAVGDDYDKAVDFVCWLWKLLKNSENRKTDNFIKNPIRLPVKGGKVSTSNSVFLSSEYGNPIGDAIFSSLSGQYHPLAEIPFYDDSLIEDRIRFFGLLGVLDFPKIEQIDFKLNRNTFGELSIEEKYIKSQISDFKNDWRYFTAHVRGIRKLDEILKNTSMEVIVKWLINESSLYSHVEHNESSLTYRPAGSGFRYDYSFKKGIEMPSYMQYVISNIPWIELKGEKLKPKEVIYSNSNLLKQCDNLHCISEKDISEMSNWVKYDSGRTKKDVLRDFLFRVGVRRSILDVDSETFYSLLLKLPELDKSSKLSKDIYRMIIENSKSTTPYTRFYQPSSAQALFLDKGMVLARKSNGKAEFRPVKEVYFSNSATVGIEKVWIIDTPTRSGKKEDFQKILGIQPYSRTYEIESSSISEVNSCFIKDFRTYLPCLMSYDSENIDKVSGLNITLVNYIRIKSDGQAYDDFKQYSLFNPKASVKDWYILVPSTTDYSSIRRERIAMLLEQVFNTIFNFKAKDFLTKASQLFICNDEQRRFIVESDLGDDILREVTHQMMDSEELKERVLKKLKKDLPETDLSSYVEIRWLAADSISEQKKIACMLKKVGKNLNYISSIVGINISIADYNKDCFNQEFDKAKNEYTCALYKALKDKGIECREHFIDLIRRFECPNLEESEFEKLNFDAHMQLKEAWKNLFRSLMSKWMDSTAIEEILSKGLQDEKWSDRYHINCNMLHEVKGWTRDRIVEFEKNNENKSLMYFDNEDELRVKFKDFIEGISEKNPLEGEEQAPIQQSQLDALLMLSEVCTDIEPAEILINNSPNTTAEGGISKRQLLKKDVKLQKQGDLAEYIVINNIFEKKIHEICDFLGPDYKISWRSAASKVYKVSNQIDIDNTKDGYGCDIEVVSKDGIRTLFIEVKSTSKDKCVFHISRTEFDKAKQCLTDDPQEEQYRYRIVFVSNLQSDNSDSKSKLSYLDHSPLDMHSFNMESVGYIVAPKLKSTGV